MSEDTKTLGIEIEDDIPVPPGSDRRSVERKYPLSELKVGQSFFLPLEEGDDLKRMANRLSQARQTYQKKHEGVRLTQRMWEKDEQIGIRIWRVE
jgi:hypothetical protein|tara:strand:+ start:251 stop:535 length:285 start_codon:yes stop_codon:yes gene_type:complete